MNASPKSTLSLQGISAGYAQKIVVSNVSFTANEGQVVALIGPNGAGKSTILKAIAGLVSSSGRLMLGDVLLNGLDVPDRIAKGVSYCPQGNRIFGELSVYENLEVAGHSLAARQLRSAIDKSLSTFAMLRPLARRVAGTLSGGEQQIVALARCLITNPQLLLLDEPTAGLTPLLTAEVLQMIREIAITGVAVLMVEQKVNDTLGVSDDAICLRSGEVVYRGSASALLANEDRLASLFF